MAASSSSSSSTEARGRSSSIFESMLASMEESMREVNTMREDLQTGLALPGVARRISEEFDEVVALSQTEGHMDTPLAHIPGKGGFPAELGQGTPSHNPPHPITLTLQKSSPRREEAGDEAGMPSRGESAPPVSEGADEDSDFTATFNMLQEELQGLRETMRVHRQKSPPTGHEVARLPSSSESSSNRAVVESIATGPEPDEAHVDQHRSNSFHQDTTVTAASSAEGTAVSASDHPLGSSSSSSSAAAAAPPPPSVDILHDGMVGDASFASTADSSPPSTASTSLANSAVRLRVGSLDSIPESPAAAVPGTTEVEVEEEYEEDFEEMSRSRPDSPVSKPVVPSTSAVLDEVPEDVMPLEEDLLGLEVQQHDLVTGEGGQRRSTLDAVVEGSAAVKGGTLPSPVNRAAIPTVAPSSHTRQFVEWSAVAATYHVASPKAAARVHHATAARTHDVLSASSSPSESLLPPRGHSIGKQKTGEPSLRASSHEALKPVDEGASPDFTACGRSGEDSPRQEGRETSPLRATGERAEGKEGRRRRKKPPASPGKEHSIAPQYGDMEGVEVLASAGRSVLSPTLLNYPCPLCRSAGPVAVPAGHSLEADARDLWVECLSHMTTRKRDESPLAELLRKHFNLSPILGCSGQVAAELSHACGHWRRGLEAADEGEWTAAIDAYRLALGALPSRGGFAYISHWNAALLYHASGKAQARDRELREWRRVCRLSLPRNKGCRLCRR
ncbi:hypothetical protein FOZ63_000878 [Perkinsus olseni]|uniref:Uncharacterized protein n=1 Tax=Perkinsus olseni TaxID=32597 RepID=A0A7J6TC02_PEROL|nr:hypothetical protein FOZ63_000878 [Perkinsus olseni]KAF4742824.1 hypothetical protein FOZ62_027077 [Perkinsus olseni]